MQVWTQGDYNALNRMKRDEINIRFYGWVQPGWDIYGEPGNQAPTKSMNPQEILEDYSG